MYERVIKGYFVNPEEEEAAVIDSNARLQELLEQAVREAAERKEEERKAAIAAYMEQVTTDEEGNVSYPVDEEGNIIIPEDSEGNPLFSLSEDGKPILDAPLSEEEGEGEEGEATPAGPSPEELLADARAEAERIVHDAEDQANSILDDANAQAEALQQHAEEEGRKSGYSEGQAQALAELNDQRDALKREEADLQKQYDEARASMEGDLVKTITDVFAKYFRIEFGDSSELLTHIIENAVMNIENSRSFLVHVSKDFFEDVSGRTEELRDKVGGDATVDVIMDPTLEGPACLIETDGGIYDCSLDTELSGLVKDLQALSI